MNNALAQPNAPWKSDQWPRLTLENATEQLPRPERGETEPLTVIARSGVRKGHRQLLHVKTAIWQAKKAGKKKPTAAQRRNKTAKLHKKTKIKTTTCRKSSCRRIASDCSEFIDSAAA